MKKIIFGITSLTLGGAERVLVDIANELKKEYEVTIFTLYSDGEFESQLDYGIKLVSVYNKPYKELNIFQKKYMPKPLNGNHSETPEIAWLEKTNYVI